MKMIKPKKLCKGDVIGIISPASSPDDLTRIEKGVRYFEKFGFKVEVGKNVGKYYGYLAGTDEQRLHDIHSMFSNKNISAIICVRGGYGTPRLLDKLDYDLIRKNPKIFCGYSDITALHLAILKQCRLVTFAGPMLAVDFWNEVNPYTEENFWRVISSSKKIGTIAPPANEEMIFSSAKSVETKIIGGNMALVLSQLGTRFIPKLYNKILLLEDIGELPYRVDRMFAQLRNADVLRQISGLILGQFTDCEETDKEKRTLRLSEVIDGYTGKLKIPVVQNFPHGHVKQTITVPIGIKIKIDGKKKIIAYTEGAVE